MKSSCRRCSRERYSTMSPGSSSCSYAPSTIGSSSSRAYRAGESIVPYPILHHFISQSQAHTQRLICDYTSFKLKQAVRGGVHGGRGPHGGSRKPPEKGQGRPLRDHGGGGGGHKAAEKSLHEDHVVGHQVAAQDSQPELSGYGKDLPPPAGRERGPGAAVSQFPPGL